VQIVVNGQSRDLPPRTTLASLLAELGFARRPVAVEVNLEVVPRARHGERELCEGDRLEIVSLVGGG